MALDGNEVLYPFFKKWIEAEPVAAQGFVKKAIDELGIWMHPRYYHELPIFVPYAVRDPFCLDSSIQGVILDTEVKSHGGFVRGCPLMSFQSQRPLLNPY